MGEGREPSAEEQVLEGGRLNVGQVTRIGDTVRRPRVPGSDVVEALLLYLERVGFDGSPRFLGHDDVGRQVLTYLHGDVVQRPAWYDDDVANASRLGEMSTWLKTLHDATAGFEPEPTWLPQRPLPISGPMWTHGDPAFANAVYRDGRLVGLIDWEFAAPADALCDPAGLLAMEVRGPRMGAEDPRRRLEAARTACEAIAAGYGMSDADIVRLPRAAAVIVEDTVEFWRARGGNADDLAHLQWRASWFGERGHMLVT